MEHKDKIKELELEIKKLELEIKKLKLEQSKQAPQYIYQIPTTPLPIEPLEPYVFTWA